MPCLIPTDTPWWHPHRHADRRPLLLARNRIQAALRGWLADQDFIEVDPAALQTSPGNEAHLHAFATTAIGNDGLGAPDVSAHLARICDEKAACGGRDAASAPLPMSGATANAAPATARSSPCWNGIAWARITAVDGRLHHHAAACGQCCRGQHPALWQRQTCDPFAEPERLSVADAFSVTPHIDLLATLAPDGTPNADALRRAMPAQGLRPRRMTLGPTCCRAFWWTGSSRTWALAA